MNREEAFKLLKEYNKNPNLIKHGLAVEAVMRWYAEKFGEDEEKWTVTGLLHDFDYEIHPQAPDHPLKGAEILREKGCPDDIIEAILGHADYSGVPRLTKMSKTLFASDELAGFIIAVALVRPSKKLSEVTPESVKKKLKDKAFARQVRREDIIKGAEEIEISMDEHIKNCILALQGVSEELGL
ncbi:MAG: HDIG domain-containing protein [Patescibacteria group bacterium]|nr:HDIG domain-containing protein [Patescibacteria group bacterium]